MKQTEHYHLNQWEYPDRILMDDFNANNQKIEAALEDVAGLPHGELLRTTETDGNDGGIFEMSLSGVDWDRYLFAFVVFRQTETEARDYYVSIYGNPAPIFRSSSIVGTGATTSTEHFYRIRCGANAVMLIPVFYDGGKSFSASIMSGTLATAYCTTPLNTLTKIRFKTFDLKAMSAGSTMELWGVR